MAFVETERVNPNGSTGREGFDPSQHPRTAQGKFADCGDVAERISTARESSARRDHP